MCFNSRLHVSGIGVGSLTLVRAFLVLVMVAALMLVTPVLSFAQLVQGAPVVADSTGPSGQSPSSVFVDTSKLAPVAPGGIVARINYCVLHFTNCDASQDSGPAPLTGIYVTVAGSGVRLILGPLIAPDGNTPILVVTGNNNIISCGAGWNTVLDASVYTSGSSTAAIQITGSGNKLSGCMIKGPYLNEGSTAAALGDCVIINGTPAAANDNEVAGNFLQYCGNRGIYAVDTFRTKIHDNYVLRSWAAGIQANATVASADGEISNNWVQDTELQYNETSSNPGNGNINILSSGSGSGGISGGLQGWLIHDNFVFNTNTNSNRICTARITPKGAGGPRSSAPVASNDSGCSEGIQVTEHPWYVHVYNNYIYNTGSEGITLCQYNCSATNNYVGNSGQDCLGCGGIIQAVQNTAVVQVTMIGNTLVEGNTIWNDSIYGNPANNVNGKMNYCMWQNVNEDVVVTGGGSVYIKNNNWTGNTCGGNLAADGSGPGLINYGFRFTNSTTAPTPLVITGINLTGNTIDYPATVALPIYEDYANVTGKIYHGFNNFSYGVTYQTPGNLAYFDPTAIVFGPVTTYTGNVIDSGISAANVITDSGSLTTDGVVYGTGAKTVSSTAAGTSGTVLTGQGTSSSPLAPLFSPTPTLGVVGPGGTTGTLSLAGGTGTTTATITPQPTAGGGTLTLPNTSGTLADGASAPLSLNTTTGNLTCPSCNNGSVSSKSANYTLAAGDAGTLVSFSGGTSLIATLPAPPSSTWAVTIQNLNSTALTISCSGVQINGGTCSMSLPQYQAVQVWTNGINYFTNTVPLAVTSPVVLTPATNGLNVSVAGSGNGARVQTTNMTSSGSGDLVTLDANANTVDSTISSTAPTFTTSITTPTVNATTGYQLNGTAIQASAILTAFCLGTIGTTSGTFILVPAEPSTTANCNASSVATTPEMPMPYACTAKNLYAVAGVAGNTRL